MEDKITRIGAGNRAISDYCDALFTGVITLEDAKVVYRKMSLVSLLKPFFLRVMMRLPSEKFLFIRVS